MKNDSRALLLFVFLLFTALARDSVAAVNSEHVATGEHHPSADALADARKRVEKLALDCAKLGLNSAAGSTLGILPNLRISEPKLERAREQAEKSLSKEHGPPKASKLKSLVKATRLAANSVVKAAEAADEVDALRLYEDALFLDPQCEAAHLALGHTQGSDGTYRSPDALTLFNRRRDIADAARRAQLLDVAVELVPVVDPTMLELYGEHASAVRCEGLLIQSPISSARLLELVRASIRAMAFSNWLIRGKLAPMVKPGTVVHMPQRDAYRSYIQAALDADRIPAKYAQDALKFDGWAVHSASNRGRGTSLYAGDTLVTLKPLGALGGDLVHRYNGALVTHSSSVGDVSVPHWLGMGHHNYVCLYILGCTVPAIRLAQEDDTTRSAPANVPQGLRNAGLVGCQSWLRHLAREGRAPSLGRCVVKQEGMLRSNLLLRATSSAQWLAERDLMGKLRARCEKVWALQPIDTGTILQRTEAVIESSIPEFDNGWEDWLLGSGGGAKSVLGMIEEASSAAAENQALLDQLNTMRKRAGLGTVEFESDLSAGARDHAAYLELHDEQKVEWPGAHMEYAEGKGFTANGAWAGAHSVIAFNGSDTCLDEWFGTFYHRVPLTHPGLLRIGFGSARKTSVLDCTSLSDRTGGYEGHYPYDGQTSVPRRFVPEMPNPIPERADQSTLGYPITYQLGPDWGDGEVNLKLLLKGEEVACFYSTPAFPTNPKVAPNGCYCLMPKEPLKANAEYEVNVTGPAGDLTFHFKTGS